MVRSVIEVPGSCALYYDYVVRDLSGRVVSQGMGCSGRSFVKAFLVGLFERLIPAAGISIPDTSNVSRTVSRSTGLASTATAGGVTGGLVVGTGTNAVTISDYGLQTQIAHGVGAGQLQYGASTVNAPSSDGTGTSLILTRDFTNGSGGTITITEIGIIAALAYNYSGTTSTFLVARDLQTIALINGALVTLNYELRTTV